MLEILRKDKFVRDIFTLALIGSLICALASADKEESDRKQAAMNQTVYAAYEVPEQHQGLIFFFTFKALNLLISLPIVGGEDMKLKEIICPILELPYIWYLRLRSFLWRL